MAQKQEIEVLISEEGEIRYHIQGIKGTKCLDIGKALGASLGEVKDIEYTSEYYEKKSETNNITKQNLS